MNAPAPAGAPRTLSRAVQRHAARHADELGAVRYVASNGPGWVTYTIFVAMVAAATVYEVVRDEPFSPIPPGMLAVLLVVFLVAVSSEKLVVMDRGILIGSFAPGLHPYVVHYHQIELRTLRTFGPAYRMRGVLPQPITAATFRVSPWDRTRLTFSGPQARFARRHRARLAHALDVRIPMANPHNTLWMFGTRNPEELLHALDHAVTAAGQYPPGILTQHAWPPLRVTGRPDEAALLGADTVRIHRRDQLPPSAH